MKNTTLFITAAVVACLLTVSDVLAQQSELNDDVIPSLNDQSVRLAMADGASQPPADGAKESNPAQDLMDALTQGKILFNLRLRYEVADADGFDTSHALTARLRLGYETKAFHGFSFLAEFEGLRSVDDSMYNAAGLNGEPAKTTIADPEDEELNQLYVKYANEWLKIILGRQRIKLDDDRFVGNVGFRQLEQTYDAVSITFSCEGFEAFYAYVSDVNRIFGPDSGRDFDSDSHLINVSYSKLPMNLGKVTGFAYLLDFDNSAANSSNTYGVRLEGSQPINDTLGFGYVGSIALQEDAGDNPNDYDALYYLLEGSLKIKDVGLVALGYEVLGSDDGNFAVRTPLATLHKFQGYADVFLVTPAAGIRDLHVKGVFNLPGGVKFIPIYWFLWTDESGGDLGEEFDMIFTKAINENIQATVKFAFFDGDQGIGDVYRAWLYLDFKF